MSPRSLRRLVLALSTAVFATAVVRGGAELVLVDGRVVSGDSIQRDGDVYVLTTETGAITMPADLVKEVRLSGTEPPAPAAPPPQPAGFRSVGPETLAGPGIQPPTTNEQFAVFGKPVEWRQGPVDTTWVPTSAYDMNKDVMADSRSTWSKDAIDSTWVPTDGFKKSGW